MKNIKTNNDSLENYTVGVYGYCYYTGSLSTDKSMIDHEKAEKYLRSLSIKAHYISFFGILAMVISVFVDSVPWVISIIPIMSGFFLDIVSVIGKSELIKYREIKKTNTPFQAIIGVGYIGLLQTHDVLAVDDEKYEFISATEICR
jgi:hypothetical protein